MIGETGNGYGLEVSGTDDEHFEETGIDRVCLWIRGVGRVSGEGGGGGGGVSGAAVVGGGVGGGGGGGGGGGD